MLAEVANPRPVSSRSTRRLAYILAASHSGSTLLAMLLGSHPEICTVGELKGASRGKAETYRCSCGSLIRECSFWNNVNDGMEKRGRRFEITRSGTNVLEVGNRYIQRLLQPLHRGPALEFIRDTCLALSPEWRKHLKEVQSQNAALVDTLLEVSDVKLVVDSSKVALRLKYLLRNPELDMRVLRMTRDGRGVSLTHINPSEFADAADPKHRAGGTGGRLHIGLPMREAALLWRRSNEEADVTTAQLPPSQWMSIRYEDLCARPNETLARVCDFLGVSQIDLADDFRQRKEQHVVGNGMRFNSTSEISLDERWRVHLTAEQLADFDAVAGDLNRKYGYA